MKFRVRPHSLTVPLWVRLAATVGPCCILSHWASGRAPANLPGLFFSGHHTLPAALKRKGARPRRHPGASGYQRSMLAGGASAITQTRMQVIFASRTGRTAGKKKPGRRRPGVSDRTRIYVTIELTDRQWPQEKARPQEAGRARSRCCPPVVGRRTVEIMRPFGG
jgi:hypothetical protein